MTEGNRFCADNESTVVAKYMAEFKGKNANLSIDKIWKLKYNLTQ